MTFFTFFVFKNEHLNKPLRRLLKEDAVPTLFDYNKNKQTKNEQVQKLEKKFVEKDNYERMHLSITAILNWIVKKLNLNQKLTVLRPKQIILQVKDPHSVT